MNNNDVDCFIVDLSSTLHQYAVIRRQLLLEMEWLIGTKDNAFAPVVWLNDVVPRLFDARTAVILNDDEKDFLNNKLNILGQFNVEQLHRVHAWLVNFIV